MPATVEAMVQEALELPASGRALLVEKLLASLAGDVDDEVEKAHLQEIEKRRSAVKNGEAKLINGAEGLKQARAAMQK